MENWYEKTRAKTETIFQEIVKHGFVVDMMEGRLDKDIFGFYVNQDSLYLSEYKNALVKVGVKCLEPSETQFFFESATGIIAVEDALHKLFVDPKYLHPTPSPTCELYNSYLSRIVNDYGVEVGLAAVLPCFTIYKEVGDYILAHQSNQANNPYQSWIETYSGDDFSDSVKKAIEITNKYALSASPDTLKLMEESFIKTSKLEWMFWDSAYRQEAWKI